MHEAIHRCRTSLSLYLGFYYRRKRRANSCFITSEQHHSILDVAGAPCMLLCWQDILFIVAHCKTSRSRFDFFFFLRLRTFTDNTHPVKYSTEILLCQKDFKTDRTTLDIREILFITTVYWIYVWAWNGLWNERNATNTL